MQQELAQNIVRNGYFYQLKVYLRVRGIQDSSIDNLLPLFKVKTLKKDDFFAVEGETSDRLGFVVHGNFVMYNTNIRGDMDVKEFISVDNFILSLWNTNLSLATIQALTDSIILEASYSEVKRLYDTDPQLDAMAKKGAEDRINVICAQMNMFKKKTSAERYQIFREKYSHMERVIPQYLVASYLGITPTQLSRLRKTLG